MPKADTSVNYSSKPTLLGMTIFTRQPVSRGIGKKAFSSISVCNDT